MSQKTIGIFVGSARRSSYNKAVAEYIAEQLAGTCSIQWMRMDDLPLFNQDFDDDFTVPVEWTRFREEVAGLDGYLFVTPEYNRSFPPLLKNALDIVSRPPGKGVWAGKPEAILSASPGRQGGFGATHHLRQVLSFLDIRMMNQPEVYLGGVDRLLDEMGTLADAGTKAFLDGFVQSFIAWMGRN